MNLAHLVALHSIDGIGAVRLKRLLDFLHDPKVIWECSKKELQPLKLPPAVIENLFSAKKTLDPETYLQNILRRGIKILTIFDKDYPILLKNIYDPPIVIYYKGIFPIPGKSLAIVGSRKMSSYGKIVTEQFALALAKAGFVIVSGLARGVDTIAHSSALAAHAKTIAVLGGGLSKIFPEENTRLAQNIIDADGAVISEYSPNSASLPRNFPARNRIIAGLCQGVLITEAALDSGSLITAQCSLENGRDTWAIPGPITSILSQGCNKLLQNGAELATAPDDILSTFGITGEILPPPDPSLLNSFDQVVLKNLGLGQLHLDDLIRSTAASSAEVSASLIKMEISGFVKNLGGGTYTRSSY